MKKAIPILFLFLAVACTQKFKSGKIWTVEFDTVTSELYMKETSSSKPQTIDQVIAMLNRENPKIQLELRKIVNDTAFVKIEDSEFLTQQCGTAGADSYLASVIYNLSEFENIEYINFDFDFGDHASPGTHSRKDFIRF